MSILAKTELLLFIFVAIAASLSVARPAEKDKTIDDFILLLRTNIELSPFFYSIPDKYSVSLPNGVLSLIDMYYIAIAPSSSHNASQITVNYFMLEFAGVFDVNATIQAGFLSNANADLNLEYTFDASAGKISVQETNLVYSDPATILVASPTINEEFGNYTQAYLLNAYEVIVGKVVNATVTEFNRF